MPAVCIARHAETTWNVTGRYQGRLESELSELGKAQSEALADALRPYNVQRIISSPLSRCVLTAQPLAQRLALAIESDVRLIEIAHGTWEGRYRDELAANDPKRYKAWRTSPATVAFENGESIRDVLARWRDFVQSFQTRVTTLIVTHDVIVRLALLERTERPLEDFWKPAVVNGAFADFDVSGGVWKLRSECVFAHLTGLEADISVQAL